MSDIASVSSKEFLDIRATIECGFIVKRVRDMIRTYSQIILVLQGLFKINVSWRLTNMVFQKQITEKAAFVLKNTKDVDLQQTS